MITVAHEALIDLIVDADGHVDPRLGGAGFNVTRAVARLGMPAAYLGRLSGDRFGQLIRADLARHGVAIAIEAASAAPTTLALVDLDPAGVPSYHFYLDGTSAAAVGPDEAVLPEGTTAVHAGSLCLVMEPVGTSTEHMMVSAPGSVIVMLDPNCRPSAIASRPDYLDRLMRILHRADVVKVSTEDLAYLYPGQAAGAAAADLLARGPACVVLTDGAAPARAFTAGGETIRADVPAAPVVDTVGAGDAFGGAFLAWWIGHGLGRASLADPDPVSQATRAAIHAAVLTTTRRGAEPPWAYELAGHDGWRWLPRASLPAQQDAADERGLADVLCAVVDHADQPHAQRHRRVPALVHDPVQVRVRDLGDQLHGLLVHRVLVPGEQVPAGHRDQRHLVRGVPVSGVVRLERQLEPLAVLGPHLRHPERVGQVIVLYPGQVPDQPGDGVRRRVEALRELAAGQPPHYLVDILLDTAEAVGQDFRARHSRTPFFQTKNVAERAGDTPLCWPGAIEGRR
jgi:fructokinase